MGYELQTEAVDNAFPDNTLYKMLFKSSAKSIACPTWRLPRLAFLLDILRSL